MAGLYVHIPFCNAKCLYCDFFSGNQLYLIDSYVDALCVEMELRSKYVGGESIQTIYFGGGTPSLLSYEQFDKIFSTINFHFQVSGNAEITVDCNPENITSEYVDGLIRLGVNRISLGVQFLSDEKLVRFNRKHSSILIMNALEIISQSLLTNLSVDLIYNVPDLSDRFLEESLEKLFEYDIKHISAYSLTISKNSQLFWKIKKGEFNENSEDINISQYNLIHNFLISKGFEHYEVSNYAKRDFISQHNASYWDQVTYLGIGVSAHSYNRFSRQWNHTNSKKYIRDLLGISPFVAFEIEHLTVNQLFNEYVILKLRTSRGLSFNYVKINFNDEIFLFFTRTINTLNQQNHFVIQGDSIVPKESDLMLADYLAKILMI